MKIYFTIVILGSLLFSCKSQKPDEVEKITSHLTKFLTIDCNASFKNEPLFSSLVACDIFIQEEDTIITLLDYIPSNLYFYSFRKNRFIKEYKIPTDYGVRAGVYKTYDDDSVLYFNSDKEEFIIADSSKILKRYSFNHYYGDSSAKVYSIINRLEKVEGMFGMMIFLSYNSKTINNYSKIRQKVPIVGLFEIREDSIYYEKINFYNPIPIIEGERRISNIPFFLTNPKKSLIIYTYKNTDSLFTYNVLTKKAKRKKIKGERHPINPTIWRKKMPKDQFTGEVEMKLANKSNGVTTMLYNEITDLYYRQINIRKGKDMGKSFLQIISNDFIVVHELEIPNKYQRGLILINGNLLFNYYDKKNKQIVYEKFTLYSNRS